MNNGKHGNSTLLTVTKCVPTIPEMPQNLSAQFVCPSPKALDFNEKRLHLVSVVRASVKWPHFSEVTAKTKAESLKNWLDFCAKVIVQ